MARNPITGRVVRDPIAEAAARKKKEDEDKEKEEEPSGGGGTTTGKSPPPPETPDIEVFRDEQGNIVGIKEGGKFLMGFEQDEAQRFLARRQLKGGGQIIEATVAAQQRVEQKRLQSIEEEKERLLAEEQPTRVELDPTRTVGEKLPILGGSLAGGLSAGGFLKKFLDLPLLQEPIAQQDLRTEALNQIQKEEIERGLTANEATGALVEGIPILGSLATQYAGGLIETPSENAKQVFQNIRKERRRISNIETNVKLGYLPVEAAQEQIEEIEQNMQRLESRLKMLIQNSPELKFNSDLVNTMETDILAAREKLFQAKLNVLTGAIRDPTDLELFNKLQEQEDGDEDGET